MDTKHTLMLNANTEQAATQLLWLSTSFSFFLYSGSRIFQRGFCLCVPYLIRPPCINLIRFGQHDRKMAASRSLDDNFLLQTLHTLRKLMRPKVSAGGDAVPQLSVCILVCNGDSQTPSNARTIKPGPPTRTQLTQERAHAHTRTHAHTHAADSQASSLSKYLVYSDLAPRPKSAIMRHGERVVLATCYGGYRGKAGGVEAFVSVSRLRTVCHYSNSTQVHAVRGLFLQSFWGKAYLKLAPRASGPRKVGGQPTLVFGTLIAFMCFCTVLSFLICKCVKIAPSHHTVSDAGTSTSRPDAYVSQDAAYLAKTAFAETRGSQHDHSIPTHWPAWAREHVRSSTHARNGTCAWLSSAGPS